MPPHCTWSLWRIDREEVLQEICYEMLLRPPGGGTMVRMMPYSVWCTSNLLFRLQKWSSDKMEKTNASFIRCREDGKLSRCPQQRRQRGAPVSRHLPSTKPAVPLVSRDLDATLLIAGNLGYRTCVSSHACEKGRGMAGIQITLGEFCFTPFFI